MFKLIRRLLWKLWGFRKQLVIFRHWKPVWVILVVSWWRFFIRLYWHRFSFCHFPKNIKIDYIHPYILLNYKYPQKALRIAKMSTCILLTKASLHLLGLMCSSLTWILLGIILFPTSLFTITPIDLGFTLKTLPVLPW